MSIDTIRKKLAILNYGLPWWNTLPLPVGSFSEGDRLHLLHLCPDVTDDVWPDSKSVIKLGPVSSVVTFPAE